ncbi:MAG: enoyl-CoA hydratase/isomerase family protein [Bacteroidia bacterium]|nr:enoyl-CoA hydratase/isomerase family protein [Bacteroidia bacterium]
MSNFRTILYSVQQHCCTITLNRPEKGNALHFVMIRELKEALQLAEADTTIRVVVVNAAGNTFCAGQDMEYLSKLQGYGFDENLQDSVYLLELFTKLYKYNKLVISVVQGAAIGSGATLASLADYTIATPNAYFQFSSVKYGYVPALDMIFLPIKIGEAKSRELLLIADPIPAEEAQKIGLISKVTEPENLNTVVQNLVTKISTENSMGAIEFTKRMLADLHGMTFSEASVFAAKINAHTRTTAEAKQGMNDFLNKRKPSW